MPLDLADLDPETRRLMLEEVHLDEESGRLYISPRLSQHGRTVYPGLLRAAVQSSDEVGLAAALAREPSFIEMEARIRNGREYMARVPVTAPTTLAEGEFSRFYLRALCRRAIEAGCRLEVYRARQVSHPRPESEVLIGREVDPQALLADLRRNIGLDTSLGIPGGPNSGISVRLK